MPQRIISLTASLTEILFALESGDRVVGITDSCDYPAAVRDLPNVGCWFDPDMAKLLALKPDLVIGLQTAHGQVKSELESHGIRFILVNPLTVEGAIADIARIGEILGVPEVSERLVSALAARLSAVDKAVSKIDSKNRQTACRILDLEDGRFHVAGPLSFQYDIISRAGGQNVTGSKKEAYPKITLSELRKWNPQVIFNCGFDLKAITGLADKPEWQSLQAVQSHNVFTFDCALTCRTGPRIVDMVELLFKTLYQEFRV
ncbi:MAG: ABC transporter substrate-binding protein [Desulfobacterales bacterium]